jgi:predicted nucleotidyltransferase
LKNLFNYFAWINEEERTDFYKKELNTSFWENEKFDPRIKEKLLKIAHDFSSALKIKIPIQDIQLTGSLANYNYTDKSDLDVHVLIDYKDIDDNVDLVKKSLDGLRFIWNLRHNIILRGHDVELYVQDVNELHTSSGLYSLKNGQWIKKPKYNPPSIDYSQVDKKFLDYTGEIHKMENLVNSSDFSSATPEEIYKRAVKLKKKIMDARTQGLRKEGEFSSENLVFKKLRNEGYIEKVINLISKSYEKIYNE